MFIIKFTPTKPNNNTTTIAPTRATDVDFRIFLLVLSSLFKNSTIKPAITPITTANKILNNLYPLIKLPKILTTEIIFFIIIFKKEKKIIK